MRGRGAVALVVAALSIVAAPVAGAQETPTTTAPGAPTTLPPEPTTTTTEPAPTTTVPGSTTLPEQPPDPSTPTTTVPAPGFPLLPPATIPPALAGDPRAPVLLDPSPDDGGEVPIGQGVFDPGTNQILAGKVTELTGQLKAAEKVLSDLQTRLVEQQMVVDDLTTRLDQLGDRVQRNIAAAAAAEQELKDHTVEAFITGTSEDKLTLVRTADPVQIGVARELLGSVVDTDEEVIARYKEARAALDEQERQLSSDLAAARTRVLELEQLIAATVAETASTAQALAAYENGSQVYVRGFVFPVQGEVEFIDSWGYPRMSGTSYAHWHQGTDIFAPRGTPLVAAESGVLDNIGVATLGGNKLWVKGDSGTEYYYAHLTAFADGVREGMRVNAGDVVGYVGDTGNARGTPPHLHFEVHPGGGPAVNPYPLLKATYGNRPMVQVVPVTATDPATTPATEPVTPPAPEPVDADPAATGVPPAAAPPG